MNRPRYCIRASVDGLGLRQHVVIAPDPKAAWERYQRVYPDRTCVHIQTVESENGKGAGA